MQVAIWETNLVVGSTLFGPMVSIADVDGVVDGESDSHDYATHGDGVEIAAQEGQASTDSH